LVPFLRAGGWLFGDSRFSKLGREIIDQIQSDLWGSFGMLWNLTVYAVVLWLIISPIIIVVLYKILKPALVRLPFEKPSHKRSAINV
jgi:hypothetical protein